MIRLLVVVATAGGVEAQSSFDKRFGSQSNGSELVVIECVDACKEVSMADPLEPHPEGDDLHGKGGLELQGEHQADEQLAHDHVHRTSCTEDAGSHGSEELQCELWRMGKRIGEDGVSRDKASYELLSRSMHKCSLWVVWDFCPHSIEMYGPTMHDWSIARG